MVEDLKAKSCYGVTVLATDGSLDHFAHFLHDLVWPLYQWLQERDRLRDAGITIVVNDKKAARYEEFLREIFNCSFEFGRVAGATPVVLLGMESSNRRHVGLKLRDTIGDPEKYLRRFQSFVFSQLGVEAGMPERLVLIERRETSEPEDDTEGPSAGRGADRRAIANHEEVWMAMGELAEEKGLVFQNVVLGEMTLKEQVEAFANAKVVVGQHGAGLHHLLWMPWGSLIQEVHKGYGDFHRLRCICDFFGHATHQKMVCPVENESSIQGSIKVDVNKLVKKLKKGMES